MWRHFFLKENSKARWIFAVSGPIYVIVFFILLQPRKNDLIPYNYSFLNLGITLLIYFSLFIFMIYILPRMIPSFFEVRLWRFSRFNVWFLILILLGFIISMFIDFFSFQIPFNSDNIWKYFVDYQIPSDIFVIIPIYIFFLLDIPILYNTKKLVNEIDVKSNAKYCDKSSANSVYNLKFFDQNQKNPLEITTSQLVYITTSDNYVDIFYKINETVERVILRNTLKGIEDQCTEIPCIFRCHKTFIVNMQKVTKIEGNAKRYYFVLEDVVDKIPISRTKNEMILEQYSEYLS